MTSPHKLAPKDIKEKSEIDCSCGGKMRLICNLLFWCRDCGHQIDFETMEENNGQSNL